MNHNTIYNHNKLETLKLIQTHQQILDSLRYQEEQLETLVDYFTEITNLLDTITSVLCKGSTSSFRKEEIQPFINK